MPAGLIASAVAPATRAVGDRLSVSRPVPGRAPVVAAGSIGLAIWATFAALGAWAPNTLFLASQEDGPVEWTTFWAFLLAAFAWARVALGRRRDARGVPWFSAGVALFCFVVAMEEISWGQRALGFRPPGYFLAHNAQYEVNVHNLLPAAVGEWSFEAVLLAYGVLLPLLATWPAGHTRLAQLGVQPPSLSLVPLFVTALVMLLGHSSGAAAEWVEMTFGLGLLLGALERRGATGNGPGRAFIRLWLPALLALALGFGSAQAGLLADDGPSRIAEARLELAALQRDLYAGKAWTACGLNKRLDSYVTKYRQDAVVGGEFAGLVREQAADRARFFLDPWDAPYWIEDVCNDDRTRRRITVYSTGPNRRRDSSSWTIAGDDLAVVLHERGSGDPG